MFIIEITYTKDIAVIDEHLAEHRTWLDTKYQIGALLCSGPKNPRVGGILIALLKSKSDVESLIREDPFYKHQVAEYSITEFTPVKWHPAIKELCI